MDYTGSLTVTFESGMGEIVNLRKVRKRAARRKQERDAAENRSVHGLNKAERAAEQARRAHARRLLDAHRIDKGSDQ